MTEGYWERERGWHIYIRVHLSRCFAMPRCARFVSSSCANLVTKATILSVGREKSVVGLRQRCEKNLPQVLLNCTVLLCTCTNVFGRYLEVCLTCMQCVSDYI